MSRRFFANPLPPAGPATLSKKLGHHLGRIVRTSPGDSVVLFDGAGNETLGLPASIDVVIVMELIAVF